MCTRAHMVKQQSLFLVSRDDSPIFTIEWFVVGATNGEQRECTRDTAAASFVVIQRVSLSRGRF